MLRQNLSQYSYITSSFFLAYPKYLSDGNCAHPTANKFLMDFVGVSRRKVQTFQGEPRRKMLKSIAVGLMCPTLLWLTEHAFDCPAGFALGVGIEVRINVCRGTHVAVPEPHLNDFHIDILRHEERRAGVA